MAPESEHRLRVSRRRRAARGHCRRGGGRKASGKSRGERRMITKEKELERLGDYRQRQKKGMPDGTVAAVSSTTAAE
jgi:hypothetical protein